MAGALGPQHVSRVRTLYKTILRLHRGLPLELKALGDEYVKSEFRRHKAAEVSFVAPFMTEWAKYALDLAHQLQARNQNTGQFGAAMSPDDIDDMQPEQVTQLYELFRETTKPVDPDNPLGDNPASKPAS